MLLLLLGALPDLFVFFFFFFLLDSALEDEVR
jgi:hypothetical protein